MLRFISNFIRVWKKSPLMAVTFFRRKTTRKAKEILSPDEWNGNWLGEEMRPYNSSLHQK
jgi:hypothetical protein